MRGDHEQRASRQGREDQPAAAGAAGAVRAAAAALLAVVEHCTVHNSIRQAPQVNIELEAAAVAA
jgi:hypothetical protein